jgi:hypothetical protein
MRWVEYVACMADVINAHNFFYQELGHLKDQVINGRIIIEFNREIVVCMAWTVLIWPMMETSDRHFSTVTIHL